MQKQVMLPCSTVHTVQEIARIMLDKAQYSTVYLQYTIENRRVQQLPYARVDAGRSCKNQVMGPNICNSIVQYTGMGIIIDF